MRRGLFITATDTEVGKTWITGHLAGVLREDGLDVGVWKPVQCGCLTGEPEADSQLLKVNSGVTDSEQMITPFSFRAALAPAAAAIAQGESLHLDQILQAADRVFAAHEIVLVEGVGGLAVPLTESALVVDLAVRLALPLVIVARPGLGTINHTLLTLAYARAHGLKVAGIVFTGYLNGVPDAVSDSSAGVEGDGCEASNPYWVRTFGNTEILGRVPHVPPASGRAACRQALRHYLEMDTIRQWIGE